MRTNKKVIIVVLLITSFFVIKYLDCKEGYRKILAQNVSNGSTIDLQLVKQWILDEINNNSLMRNEIKNEISDIEENGRNANRLIEYYSSEKKYVNRLIFRNEDIEIKQDGKDTSGIYSFTAIIKAKDNFRGGYSLLSFQFSFKIKSEYQKSLKTYTISVCSYPAFIRKDCKEFNQ